MSGPEGPERGQEGPERSQEGPKPSNSLKEKRSRWKKRPKRCQGRDEEGPERGQEEPRAPQRGARRDQRGAKMYLLRSSRRPCGTLWCRLCRNGYHQAHPFLVQEEKRRQQLRGNAKASTRHTNQQRPRWPDGIKKRPPGSPWGQPWRDLGGHVGASWAIWALLGAREHDYSALRAFTAALSRNVPAKRRFLAARAPPGNENCAEESLP